MSEVDKEVEATKTPQAVSGMDKDEMATELVAAMLAGKTIDARDRPDLPIDVGFIAQVPFIMGGIG